LFSHPRITRQLPECYGIVNNQFVSHFNAFGSWNAEEMREEKLTRC
jgi:hypothetical protein